ncbi:MAG: hypothetical protein GQ470_00685 [Gammaproteobacteria bacterium]|nr:hypothetical protein [Gammaproteobacteria bacterium]
MKLTTTTIFILFFTLYASISNGREVAGVDIAESIHLADTKLVLNGSGIRTKFFFKIYVCSLYSKNKSSSLSGIIDQGGPYRISMYILYDEISGKKLNAAWADGFESNLSVAERQSLQPAIDTFYSLFETVHKGDVIDIDVNKVDVTTVYLNGDKRGDIENSLFPEALLQIWLGDEPADDDLKEAMLGG